MVVTQWADVVIGPYEGCRYLVQLVGDARWSLPGGGLSRGRLTKAVA